MAAIDLSNLNIVQYHTDRKWGLVGRIIVGLTLLSVGWQFFSGYVAKSNELVDEKKSREIAAVMQSLSEFYKDSSPFLENRYYPIAKCSNDLNEFDFEYTLRGEVTGKKPGSLTQEYIKVGDFPSDSKGSYTNDLSNNFKCTESLSASEQTKGKYFDNSRHCNFNINSQRNCYLYTSSLIGDSYKIAYWSPYYKKFVVFSKFRDEVAHVTLF